MIVAIVSVETRPAGAAARAGRRAAAQQRRDPAPARPGPRRARRAVPAPAPPHARASRGTPAPPSPGPPRPATRSALDFAGAARRADAAGLPDQRLQHVRRASGRRSASRACPPACAPWSSPTARSASARPRCARWPRTGSRWSCPRRPGRTTRVPGAPYFVLVDGVDPRRGRGDQLVGARSLVGDAIEDAARRRPAGRRARADRARTAVDRTLAAAGHRPRAPEPVSRPRARRGAVTELAGARLRGRGGRGASARPGRPEASRCWPASPRSASGAATAVTWSRWPLSCSARSCRRGALGGGARRARRARPRRSRRPACGCRCSRPVWCSRSPSTCARDRRRDPAGRSTSAGCDEFRGWVYGLGYGAQLGLGVSTVVSSAATYVALLAALLCATPRPGR